MNQEEMVQTVSLYLEEEEQLVRDCYEAINDHCKSISHPICTYTFELYSMYTYLRDLRRAISYPTKDIVFHIYTLTHSNVKLKFQHDKYFVVFMKEIIDIINSLNVPTLLQVDFSSIPESHYTEIIKYMYGNTCITHFGIKEPPSCPSDRMFWPIELLLRRSCIIEIALPSNTPVIMRQKARDLALVPLEYRETPVASNTKSAAKTS